MIERLKISGGKWKEQIASVGIIYLSSADQIKNALKQHDLLPVSRCSATKGTPGTPKEFYRSPQNIQFYKWCETHQLKYGILSDGFGLVLSNESVPYYDIHPSQVTEIQFRKLAVKIKRKMDGLGYGGFLFFNSSPIMASPYFYMMQLTGLKMFYITKLVSLNQPKGFFNGQISR